MNKNYQIYISDKAKESINLIHSYIYKEFCTIKAANTIVYKIESSMRNLEYFPFMGKIILSESLEI